MSGKTAINWLREAREGGYILKAYFLWVRDPEIVIARVRQRVVEGGHDIQEDVSRRRFFKTIQNFFALYRPLLHTWKLIENNLQRPRLLALEKYGRLVVRDTARLAQIQQEAEFEL